jgi:hypothetical protein
MRVPRGSWQLSALTAFVWICWCDPSSAQQTETPAAQDVSEDPNPTSSAESAPSVEELASTIESMKKRMEELETWKQDSEMAALESEAEGVTEFRPSFSVYGIMDFGLFRSWVKSDNVLKNVVNEELSFVLTHLNLFFKSMMTPSLSAMAEVRFTFAPHGNESFVPYQRVDATVTESTTMRQHVLGGVSIERALTTWQKWDFLGVTVGRFITPYGIWNVEHGSPVCIPIFLPYIWFHGILPNAQTGLMLHGRFFPGSNHYIEYAITAANNRADVEASLDFNDNKALGLRLRVLYETPKLTLSLGGYGYLGQVNVQTKKTNVDMMARTVKVKKTSTDKHTELTGSLDLLIAFAGIRLQVEYARSLVKYDVHPIRVVPIFNFTIGEIYFPDHTRWDGYALLAYELPLQKILGDMTLTPFVMGEMSSPEDLDDSSDASVIRAGFNFKPNHFWVIKLEGSRLWTPNSPYVKSSIYFVGAQLAVWF